MMARMVGRPAPATLRDVARLAEVHPGTVSRALNEDTRRLVGAASQPPRDERRTGGSGLRRFFGPALMRFLTLLIRVEHSFVRLDRPLPPNPVTGRAPSRPVRGKQTRVPRSRRRRG